MANTPLSTYKTIPVADLSTRPSSALTNDESTKIDTILSNFFTYFKAKHSS